MYNPIALVLDMVLGSLWYGSRSRAAKEYEAQALIEILRQIDEGLGIELLHEGTRTRPNPKLLNAASALLTHASVRHQNERLRSLAEQVELLLRALEAGKASDAQSKQLQGIVRGQLARLTEPSAGVNSRS